MSEVIEIKLNAREEVIQRVLAMTEDEANALLEYIEHIEELEDAEDAAYVAQHKDEGGVSIDEVLAENGFTREELEAEARAEGLIK